MFFLQNQTTLIDSVPVPVLDPSERPAIVAAAAAEKADAVAAREPIVLELQANRLILAAIRAAILSQVASLRSTIREKADAIQIALDQAVDAAQLAKTAQLDDVRVHFELLEILWEREVLRWMRDAENVRSQAQTNFINIRTESLALLARALQAFESADRDINLNREKVLAAVEILREQHLEKVARAIIAENARKAGEKEKFWDDIQFTLGIIALAPTLTIGASLLNASVSAGRRDAAGVVLNLTVAFPWIDDAAKASAMLTKHADEGVSIGKSAVNTDERFFTGAGTRANVDEAAEAMYDIIRSQTDDVERIAKNLAIPERIVRSVKEHFFNEVHNIFGVMKRFDADSIFATMWQAAANGKLDKDKLRFFSFLAHEYIEHCLMKSGIPFRFTDDMARTVDELGAHELAPSWWNTGNPWYIWEKWGMK